MEQQCRNSNVQQPSAAPTVSWWEVGLLSLWLNVKLTDYLCCFYCISDNCSGYKCTWRANILKSSALTCLEVSNNPKDLD